MIFIFIVILIIQIIQFVRIKHNKKCYAEKSMVSYQGLVWIPWAISVGFVCILFIMNIVGTNKSGKELLLYNLCSILVLVVVPLFVTQVLSCWRITFNGEDIVYRNMLGTSVIPYSQINEYGYNQHFNNLYIYLHSGKRIKISDTLLFINMCDCSGILQKHGVSCEPTPERKSYKLCWPLGYRLLMYACTLISFISIVGIVIYDIWWGMLVAIPCLLVSLYYSIQYTNYMITIYNDNIVIRKGLKTISYTWKELKYVSWPNDGSVSYLELIFPRETFIIEPIWKNFEDFLQDVEKRHVKWK